jgi:mono/diheme cytochrome c family protein
MNTAFRRLLNSVLAVALLISMDSIGEADDVTTSWKKDLSVDAYPQQSGEALYRAICQGCHMADAKGAIGAGSYPALAHNPRLQSRGYVLSVVANGSKAMPRFAGSLTEVQIAAVVNYVRTHFGNRYADNATAGDVKGIHR